ncbi:hypothetical protein AB0L64_19655 [Kribbella sp. NPDC051936]|uniref:hypothetical protein n=1 Tax=Kribbella sp. NPDC051936 TaxID=3154946 RepID=UPI00341A863D
MLATSVLATASPAGATAPLGTKSLAGIPGVTIDSKTALRSDGARLTTALPGGTIKVDVLNRRCRLIRLIDADRNDANPLINPRAFDINKGNRQIAHGIWLVLRPIDI